MDGSRAKSVITLTFVNCAERWRGWGGWVEHILCDLRHWDFTPRCSSTHGEMLQQGYLCHCFCLVISIVHFQLAFLELVWLLPSALCTGQSIRTHVPLFTKQYNLVPVKGWWCSGDKKVIIGLASRWPCITNFVVYIIRGIDGLCKRNKHRACTLLWGMAPFTLLSADGQDACCGLLEQWTLITSTRNALPYGRKFSAMKHYTVR